MTFEQALDRLYQVPLPQFVAERKALAKAVPNGGAIGAAPKPTVAAWAINQLFWKRRAVLDKVLRAAERVRDVQLQRLAGKGADPGPSERDLRAAIESAVGAASEVLAQAGEHASAATLDAVRETLQTLPSTTLDGRLVRPLKPTGLEGLAALMSSGARITPRKPATVLPMPQRRATKADAAHDTLRRLREEIYVLARELRRADAEARQARAAAEQAQAAVGEAESRRADAEAALEKAVQTLAERRRGARDAERGAEQADRTRGALERQLIDKRAEADKLSQK
jgi:hypothetical protein